MGAFKQEARMSVSRTLAKTGNEIPRERERARPQPGERSSMSMLHQRGRADIHPASPRTEKGQTIPQTLSAEEAPTKPASVPGMDTYSLSYYLNNCEGWGNISSMKQLATKYGFDPQTHIVEPDAHSEWLDALEDYVFRRSELGIVQKAYDAADENFKSLGAKNIPPRMIPYVRRAEGDPAEAQPHFGSLMKSYVILTRIIETFDTLVSQGFAGSSSPSQTPYYSFLLERSSARLAELRAIDRSFLETFQESLETAARKLVVGGKSVRHRPDDPGASIRESILPILKSFLDPLSDDEPMGAPESTASLLRLCRVTVLLCDLALLSYVGSHNGQSDRWRTVSGGDASPNNFDVESGIPGAFSFRCQLRRLTCLDGLLDSKPVWVFRLSAGGRIRVSETSSRDSEEARLSVVTRIELLADIWGPVHAVPCPEDDSKIIQYNISKGLIRRTATPRRPGYKDAVICHWEGPPADRGGMVSLSSRFESPRTRDHLPLSPDDLLLIGADGFVTDDACGYTMDAFRADYDERLREPGTTEGEWRADSRNFAFSISRLFGVSIGTTVKKIPETTVKQAIWDSWTSKTTKPNPLVLHCYYGLSVSHCTGNAERIPLKAFFFQDSFRSQIDLHFSNRWRTEPWAIKFLRALQLRELEPFLQYWASLDEDRERVTELVAYVLDTMNGTGKARNELKVLLIHGGEGRILPVSIRDNTWASLLKDDSKTAVYASICCLCMGGPAGPQRQSFSQCSQSPDPQRSLTLLHFQAEVKAGSPVQPSSLVLHHPTGEVLRVASDYICTEDRLVLSKPTLCVANRTTLPVIKERRSELEPSLVHRVHLKKRIYVKSSGGSWGGMDRIRSLHGTAVRDVQPLAQPINGGPDADEEGAAQGDRRDLSVVAERAGRRGEQNISNGSVGVHLRVSEGQCKLK